MPLVPRFKAAHGAGEDWAAAVKACTDALGDPPEGANLGLLYVTDALAGDLSSILTFLRERTRIDDWIGTIGFGVVGCGIEYHDQPAVSVMTAALPKDTFRVFESITAAASKQGLADFAAAQADWLTGHQSVFGIVHGDPGNQAIEEITADLAELSTAFLVGGLTASRSDRQQIAGGMTNAGLSGVLFAPELGVAVGLSQGCSLIGLRRQVTEAQGAVIMKIDDRPALEVFKEDIGDLLAHDLRRVSGYVFAAFPITSSDTGDYLVRNLTGIDESKGWISVAELVEQGRRIQFCRRDHDAACRDMHRMLRDVKRRAGAAPKAGLYYSCIARGPNLFGPDSEELRLVHDELGEIPIAGFFGNGEIFNDRLYGYTSVLALFV